MEDTSKEEEKVMAKGFVLALFLSVALLGCGKDDLGNDTGDSSPNTTDSASTDTVDTSDIGELGALLISYEFSGFPDGWRRCADTGFTQLFLEMRYEGELQPMVTWPCDDSSISVDGLTFGSWKVTLSTIEEVETATEPYGQSASFMTFIGSDEIIEPHLILQCQGC